MRIFVRYRVHECTAVLAGRQQFFHIAGSGFHEFDVDIRENYHRTS